MKAEWVPIRFAYQSRPGRLGQDGTARLVNCYSRDTGEEAKAPLQQYAIEGLEILATLGHAPIRGLYASGNVLFVLAGLTVFSIRQDGPTLVTTELGVVAAASLVTWARNRREVDPEVVLVTEGRAYVIRGGADGLSHTLTNLDDEDLPDVRNVAFLDGYFIFAVTDSAAGRFYISGIDDASNIAALDFATAETDPDQLVRVIRRKSELWLLGEVTIEVWANNGNSDFPFERLPGAAIDYGCAATHSAVVLEQALYWLADDFTVRKADGYNAKRVSTHAVEQSIQSQPDKGAIFAFPITFEGHSLYVINGDKFTWVYDTSTEMWHERRSYRRDRYRAGCTARWNGQTVIGDDQSGNLYLINPERHDEGGEPIIMVMSSPITGDTPHNLQYFAFRLGVASGQGVSEDVTESHDPHIMLRWSDDGGACWSDERRGRLGQIGQTGKEIVFGQLGQCEPQGRTFEFSISANVARVFYGAHAKIRKVVRR